MIGGAFREAPRMLACPRCGEHLARMSAGVEVCARCEGVWLAALTLESTFGTPYWPQGASNWWRRELACPACTIDKGKSEIMTPVRAGDVLVDRCHEHGVWLDAGELGRLLDAPRAVELEAFYDRVRPDAELPARLVEFRKRRSEAREQRARELEEYRARLAAEQARIRAEQAAAREAERARVAALEAAERRAALVALRARTEKERSDAEHLVADREREMHAARSQLLASERVAEQHRARVRELEQRLIESRAAILEVTRRLDDLDKELRS